MSKEKPQYNLWQNSAYMVSLAWKDCKSILLFCFLLIILTVVNNLLALYIAPTILGAIETAVSIPKLIVIILSFTIGLMLTNGLISYINTNTLFGRIEIREKNLSFIGNKFMTMSFPLTERQDLLKNLEKARKAVSDNTEATEAIWITFIDIATSLIGFLIYVILVISVSPAILFVIIATTVIAFFINRYINSWEYRHLEEEAGYRQRLNYISRISRDYTLAKDIRIFGIKGWIDDIYNRVTKTFEAFILRREKAYIWANLVDVILSFLRNGVAYLYLIHMVLKDGISAAEFLLYFSAIGGFASWIDGILKGISTLYKQSLDISIIREFVNYPEEFLFEEGQPLIPDLQQTYEIELHNVSFCYPNAEYNTLEKINLKIKAGEKLAIVGLNGAGKTTLIKLICGFYDPTEGEVLLNGINIKQYNRKDYYKLFSAVFQNFSLIPNDIISNIIQADEQIDMEKVIDSIQKAGLEDKINRLPNQYHTKIGKEVYEDGIELSGGEIQRLMLARALYKNAPIIVLDEPTAALDPIAESDIYNKYNDLTAGRTSIYISHRLASTRFCDRVLLIENNRISEEGTHESLIRDGKKYAELFEIQSRYYKGGENHYGNAEFINC